MKTIKFQKTDKIKNNDGIWECIIADEQTAVFGKITKCLSYEKEKIVSYEDIFAISQIVQDGFEFEKYIGVCEHSGIYIFEKDKYEYDPEDNNYYLKKP